MTCPSCRAEHRWRVIDSRSDRGEAVYRIRECRICGARVTTKETLIQQIHPQVMSPWLLREMESKRNEPKS